MMRDNKFYELLSPAGSFEALVSAVNAGADAVYGGGSKFNARMGADNFTDEQLERAVDYCHVRGVSFYITLNTLASDREMSEVADYISFLNRIGADALILQDLGVASLAKEIAPKLPIHASTQMSVFDTAGVKTMEELGFSRTVLARELSFDAINKISSKTSSELEVFVHGALCVCYSGQCLMSSMIGGRSGNRGRCAQPCRLPYFVNNKKGFFLSPKDLCLVRHLEKLKRAGVKSFKIEGRMKGPEYVGTVTSIYRKYLDNEMSVTDEDYKKLERIFFRGGFTDGYFKGKKGADMLCYTKPDNPYKKQDGELFDNGEKKAEIKISCVACEGRPLVVKMKLNEVEVVCESENVLESAIKVPADKERIEKQLIKLGNTPFFAYGAEVEIYGNPSVPISCVNEVRRKTAEQLEKEYAKSFKRENTDKKTILSYRRSAVKKLKTSVSVMTEEQLKAALESDCDYIYVPYKIADKTNDERVFAILPRMTTVNTDEVKIKRVVATNIGHIKPFCDAGFTVHTSHSLNVFNGGSVEVLETEKVSQIVLSPELTCSQIKGIKSNAPLEVVAYGRLPLMLTELCLKKGAAGCKGTDFITDRTGTKFPILCVDGCRNEILNSKPIVMSDKLSDIKSAGADVIQIMLTIEDYRESVRVLKMYKNEETPDFDFTRGKFYKGV